MKTISVANPITGVVITRRAVYGWIKDGRSFLSKFPREANGPAGQYGTKDEAEAEAARRNLAIEWADGN